MNNTSTNPTRALFANRNFFWLWVGQLISFLGDYFNFLAVPIIVQQLTGSTLMVGLSFIINSVPMLLLGPVAGVFVDRWDRKKTMIMADILRGLLVLMCLLVQTADQVWILYLSGFLMSCVSRFFFPSMNAALPLIVKDKTQLLTANGMMQMVQTIGMLAGPALAGFAIGWLGSAVAFWVDSISFFVSAIAVSVITIPHTTPGQLKASEVWSEMMDGVRYLFGNKILMSVLTMLMVVHLGLGAINVLWVPYLTKAFGVGPEGLGVVDSVQGMGMVIGGLTLGWLSRKLSQSWMAGGGLLIIGIMLSGMGLAPTYLWIIGISFLVGLALIPVESVLATLMQLHVPDLMRGRVGSAFNALGTAVSLISMLLASVLASVVGERAIYVVCGLITAAAGMLGLRLLDSTAPAAAAQEKLTSAGED